MTRVSKSLATLVVLMSACTATAAPFGTPVYRELKDWIVTCDNTGRCQALGMEDYAAISLRLTLDAGATSEPELVLESEPPVDPARLRLDGQPFAAAALLQPAIPPAEGTQRIGRTPADVRAFLDAIRQGSYLQVEGDDTRSASLAGLSAALLLIDETHGRLDTPTALVRRGSLPASRIPAAPPLLALRPAPTGVPPLSDAQQRDLVRSVRLQGADELQREECFVDADTAFDDARALNAREAIVLIECWRGAYQSSSLAFRLLRDGSGAPERLRLALPFAIDGERHAIDAFTSADYADGVLFHAGKGRGMGDCGESASWLFDGQRFQLKHYAVLRACRGGQPGDWPTLWRTRTP